MAIQVGGIVSGLDTDEIISKLLEFDGRIKKNLETKKTDTQGLKDLFSEFNTKLLAFKTESDNMLLSSTFQKRASGSSDTSVVTASVADGAAPGTYNIVVDTLANASVRQSTAAINSSQGFRSTMSVSPGTSPIDLTKTFATAGFDSSLNTARTVTIDTDATVGTYTSAALSTYASVQAFMDEVNAHAENINIWYDAVQDRFNVERKNAAGANTIDIDDSGANSFWDVVNIDEDAASSNTTGLDVTAKLNRLNTDTPIAAAVSDSFTLNGTTITYNTTNDSFQNLIDRINNNSATAGVVASYDQSLDRLVLRRTTEGPETITLGGTDAAGLFSGATPRFKMTNTTGFTAGSSAIFSINGSTITSSSNTYTVNGVTFTLKKGDDAPNGTPDAGDPTATITVTQDTASVATSINAFVASYNEIAQFYADNATYDAATKKGGELFGDSLVNAVDSRLKRLLFQSQPALVDTHELLAQIGIQLGDFNTADANKLVVDDAKLTAAIAANASAVEQLFGRVSNTGGSLKDVGIGKDISDYIKELTKFQGLVDVKEDYFDNKIEDIDDRIAREDDRLDRIETNLRRQFGTMEVLMSKLNAEGAALSQQLSRL